VAQNVRGELMKGDGNCPRCAGTGQVWPVLDDLRSPKFAMVKGGRSPTMVVSRAEAQSPQSVYQATTTVNAV
jgi:hypothetical protein